MDHLNSILFHNSVPINQSINNNFTYGFIKSRLKAGDSYCGAVETRLSCRLYI